MWLDTGEVEGGLVQWWVEGGLRLFLNAQFYAHAIILV